MKKLTIAVTTCAFFLVAGGGLAADIEAGAKKAKEVCAACHGADGNSPTPAFPKIAGQHEDYLIRALTDYKIGARKDPVMEGFTKNLSVQDIENLAAYFSRQKGLALKY